MGNMLALILLIWGIFGAFQGAPFTDILPFYGLAYAVWKAGVAAEYAKGAYEWAKNGREKLDAIQKTIDAYERNRKIGL